jgi:hypothetical protein
MTYTNIITYIIDDVNPLDKSFSSSLQLGEHYEDLLVKYLRLNGFDAYRPKQYFKDRGDYKRFQEDVRVKHPNGSWVTLDVKSRASRYLKYSTLGLGGIDKWDYREYSSLAMVLIDETSGLAMATWVDDKETWTKETLKEVSYVKPLSSFFSLKYLLIYLELNGYRCIKYEPVPSLDDEDVWTSIEPFKYF